MMELHDPWEKPFIAGVRRRDVVVIAATFAVALLFNLVFERTFSAASPSILIPAVSAFVAILSLSVSALTATFTVRTFRQSLSRDQRDALFKAFDAYSKIRDVRSRAMVSRLANDWIDYYRALLDLQWSEYYIWRGGALADTPYRLWLAQHYQSYAEDETQQTTTQAVSYRGVWQSMLSSDYFAPTDEFVAHMKLVHEGRVDEAMRGRSG